MRLQIGFLIIAPIRLAGRSGSVHRPPFWQVIRSTLAERPDVQVIGEVADGLEAVQKAELLEPDLSSLTSDSQR